MTKTNYKLARIILGACSNSFWHVSPFSGYINGRRNFYPSSIKFVEPFRKFQSIIRTHLPSHLCTSKCLAITKDFYSLHFSTSVVITQCYGAPTSSQSATDVCNQFFLGIITFSATLKLPVLL